MAEVQEATSESVILPLERGGGVPFEEGDAVVGETFGHHLIPVGITSFSP